MICEFYRESEQNAEYSPGKIWNEMSGGYKTACQYAYCKPEGEHQNLAAALTPPFPSAAVTQQVSAGADTCSWQSSACTRGKDFPFQVKQNYPSYSLSTNSELVYLGKSRRSFPLRASGVQFGWEWGCSGKETSLVRCLTLRGRQCSPVILPTQQRRQLKKQL